MKLRPIATRYDGHMHHIEQTCHGIDHIIIKRLLAQRQRAVEIESYKLFQKDIFLKARFNSIAN